MPSPPAVATSTGLSSGHQRSVLRCFRFPVSLDLPASCLGPTELETETFECVSRQRLFAVLPARTQQPECVVGVLSSSCSHVVSIAYPVRLRKHPRGWREGVYSLPPPLGAWCLRDTRTRNLTLSPPPLGGRFGAPFGASTPTISLLDTSTVESLDSVRSIRTATPPFLRFRGRRLQGASTFADVSPWWVQSPDDSPPALC